MMDPCDLGDTAEAVRPATNARGGATDAQSRMPTSYHPQHIRYHYIAHTRKGYTVALARIRS
jgi:hypothetical protein